MKQERTRVQPIQFVETAAQSGCPGCCEEAQADGVPCAEIGNCEKCGRAIRRPDLRTLATTP